MQNNQEIIETVFSSTVNCERYLASYWISVKTLLFPRLKDHVHHGKVWRHPNNSLKRYTIKNLNVYINVYKEHLKAGFF